MPEGFRYLDHSTDAYVESFGQSLNDAFDFAGRGLVNLMFDIEKISGKIPMTIYTEGTDEIDLLYNWLEKILLTVLVESYVMSEFKVSIYKNSNFRLEAATTVEPVDLEKHGYKLEVKGITYHAMELTECRDLVKIRYVVDL